MQKNIKSVIEEAKIILEYTNDWDGDGSEATDLETFNRACNFLLSITKKIFDVYDVDILHPYISLLRDGSVFLQWQSLLIIFYKGKNEANYFGSDIKGIEFKGNILNNEIDETLVNWFKNNLNDTRN